MIIQVDCKYLVCYYGFTGDIASQTSISKAIYLELNERFTKSTLHIENDFGQRF